MPPKASTPSSKAGGAGSSKPPSSAKSSAGKKKESSGTSNADFLKSENVLQAVLLADSFQVKFRPLTQQKPKVLLPLLNIPLLEYSLEFLVSGGVGELFVFCCSHAAAIQSYLDSVDSGSKWKRRKGLVVKTIVSNNCFSFGDALRHLDTLDLIKNDFVLMSGDVISNLKLNAVVKAHKERVAQDKRNMMTLIFKQASHAHRTRPLSDDAVVAIDPATNQLLLYDNDRAQGRVSLDSTLLSETKSSLQLRYDLMDSHISICTPEVLMLFTDNFDWQSFHSDFLPGVLGSEILGNKLFVHISSRDEYAARVEDLRTYDSVSKDVIHRWTYPMVPDTNLLMSSTTYRYQRGNIYKEDNVTVSREAKVEEEVTIGSGSSIDSKSVLRASVLGRNCTIGKNVSITGSYLWNDVVIEDDVVLDHAILADGVIVRRGARISRGSILSFNVVIGENHVVPPYTKITTLTEEECVDGNAAGGEGGLGGGREQDSDEEEAGKKKKSSSSRAPLASPTSVLPPSASARWSEADVGLGGVGRIFHDEGEESELGGGDDDDDEAEDDGSALAKFPYNQNELNSIAPNPRAVAAWLRMQLQEESEDEWEEIDAGVGGNGEGGDSDGGDDDEADSGSANKLGASGKSSQFSNFHKFCWEALETLRRGHLEKLSLDDISLEMNALKFSHNTTVEEFAHASFLGLFALLNEAINPPAAAAAAAAGAKGASTPSSSSSSSSSSTASLPFTPLDPSRSKAVMQSLGLILKSWWKVLGKFGKLVSDQVYILRGLEQACLRSGFVGPQSGSGAGGVNAATNLFSPSNSLKAEDQSSIYTPLFTPTLQLLYNNFQLFSEEAIVTWAENMEAECTEGKEHVLLKQSEAFRTWLQEAEEEDDEEDDE